MKPFGSSSKYSRSWGPDSYALEIIETSQRPHREDCELCPEPATTVVGGKLLCLDCTDDCKAEIRTPAND